MDQLKEISKLAKLVLVVFSKEVILINIRLLVALVEYQGILKVDTIVDYQVGTILLDTSIYNKS